MIQGLGIFYEDPIYVQQKLRNSKKTLYRLAKSQGWETLGECIFLSPGTGSKICGLLVSAVQRIHIVDCAAWCCVEHSDNPMPVAQIQGPHNVLVQKPVWFKGNLLG